MVTRMFKRQLAARLVAALLAALLALLLVHPGFAASPVIGSSEYPITAAGTISRAADFSICMQGATHDLVDAAGARSYQLKSDQVDLTDYEDLEAYVSGTVEEGVGGCPAVVTVLWVLPLGESWKVPSLPPGNGIVIPEPPDLCPSGTADCAF